MIYENVELHNVAEVREVPGHGGVRLQRVPEDVRLKLSESGAIRMLSVSGAEIRFFMEGDKASVTLSASEGGGRGGVFLGPFRYGPDFELGPEPTTIEVELSDKFKEYAEAMAEGSPFSPRVCRVMPPHLTCLTHFHGVEGDVRPPEAGEVPAVRMLNYGTSITHGGNALFPWMTYSALTAWRLDADLINLGMGGSCLAEPEFADYIAERRDWHFALFCVSVNMLGKGFTVDEYRERVRYLIERAALNPDRPVACMSLLPHSRDHGNGGGAAKATPDEFRRVLSDVIDELALPNVTLLPGPELLPDAGGLTSDLIHPSEHGMIRISENIASRLRPVLETYALASNVASTPATNQNNRESKTY